MHTCCAPLDLHARDGAVLQCLCVKKSTQHPILVFESLCRGWVTSCERCEGESIRRLCGMVTVKLAEAEEYKAEIKTVEATH
jgi:hypothetical protein